MGSAQGLWRRVASPAVDTEVSVLLGRALGQAAQDGARLAQVQPLHQAAPLGLPGRGAHAFGGHAQARALARARRDADLGLRPP